MEEKIDIILATYKTNLEYLKQQLDSILNQSYKNFKLIISDDNSENEELINMLKNYEKSDNRIELYLNTENKGYINNFEFLLSKTTANYIMFSDHDDFWYPNKLEESLKKIKENNVDLVYVNAKQIDGNGKVLENDYFKYKNVPLINKHNKLAISRCIGIGCSYIFTKDVKTKMLPYKNTVIAHDWLASFIADEGKGLIYIDKPLFDYRLHETNVFGGRNLNQNLKRWKEQEGKSYKSFLKYRKENVIDKAYLNGAKMCLDYTNSDINRKFLHELISYYENLEKSKYINFHIFKYFKFLSGKNLAKKMLKEIMIFHLPILSYIVFYIG